MFDKQLMSIPGIKKLIAKLSVLAVIQALAIMFEAIFLTDAIVQTWKFKKVTALLIPMLLFFICFALRYLITRIEDQLCDHFSNRAIGQMKKELLKKEFELGPALVTNLGSGNLVTLALEGTAKIQNYLNLVILKTINLAVIPLLLLFAVFFLDKLSGIILFFMFPIIILFMIILGYAAKDKSERQYEGFKNMSNNFIDTMRGLTTLKLFGLSKNYSKSIYNVSENYRKSTMSVLKVALLSTFALDFYTTISIAIVALFLGINLIYGNIALTPALAVLILCPDYFLPVRDYGNDYHATLDGKNALTELNQVLAKPVPHAEVPIKPFSHWTSESKLAVNGLHFSYGNEPAIFDAGFTVHGFTKIGIVGPSGSGKSTLLNLLGGYLEPNNAKQLPFSVNNEKTDSLAQTNWQKHISYLPQEPYIFAGTIAENIAFYQPDASMSDIKTAAKEAGLFQFIRSLTDGLNTRIGQGGRGISGGQAQRISLARALLDKNRDIFLLDEPTAHLDIETEYELKNTMLPLFKNHLVIFATHRLHWMNEMDWVLVMKDGQIIEQGNPQKLSRQNGEYRNLVDGIRGETNEKHR